MKGSLAMANVKLLMRCTLLKKYHSAMKNLISYHFRLHSLFFQFCVMCINVASNRLMCTQNCRSKIYFL